MASRLDPDIWYIVVDVLRAEYKQAPKSKRAAAKKALIALRLTCRFLALAAAPALLAYIDIRKFDKASLKRLNFLLSAPASCKNVKIYDLKPLIIGSRQGELSTAYHKIPPYLDYGRNSASPQIQAENKKLAENAAHWAAQNEIIYPIKSKVASSLAKTFKYSGSRGESSLRDSVYFSALTAFVNLTTLVVTYPSPRPSRTFHDVASEYGIALGRYLASNPEHLINFRAQSMMPGDLAVLESAIRQNRKDGAQDPLGLTRLEIAIENTEGPIHESLHVFPAFSKSLSALLGHMANLTALRVSYIRDAPQPHLRHLLLSPFTPPPLPNLKLIALTRLALSSEDLIALVNFSPVKLSRLFLDSISLTGPSWARVLRAFSESDTLDSADMPYLHGMSYHSLTGGSWETGQTEEDHKAYVAWKAKVDVRNIKYDDDLAEVDAAMAGMDF